MHYIARPLREERLSHKGDPITVYGDSMQTRSFCYVEDLIDGCIRHMEKPIRGGPSQSISAIRMRLPCERSTTALFSLKVCN